MAQKKENKKVYRVEEKITKKCKEEQSKINESEVKRKVRNKKIKKITRLWYKKIENQQSLWREENEIIKV